jgi:uncharacterized MAPEG superfamily protein
MMAVPMHRTHQSRYELRRAGLIRVPTRETMTFAYWMLIAAAMLPYLTIALAKSAGGIDNRAPRSSLESLSGWRQRADWAHRNHFEAFPAFAAAVFVAELTHAPQSRIDQLAGIFVLLRVIYTVLYVADQAILRSIVWSLGLIAVVWLFVLGV